MKIFSARTSLIASLAAAVASGLLAGAAVTPAGFAAAPQGQQDWPAYGGSRENNHYSSLTQINRSNVKRLAVAWSFDTHEEGGLQSSPIIIDGVLYGITPTQKIFALDAATGKLLWKFDSGIRGTQPDRGLAYWADGKDKRILETEFREESLAIAQEIKGHAEKKGMAAGHFAFNWVLANPAVQSVIAGPRTLEQWKGYLAALEREFDADDEAVVDSLVRPGHPSTPGYNDPSYPLTGRIARS